MNQEEELRKKSSAARKIRREKLKANNPEAADQILKDRRQHEEFKANNPEAKAQQLKERRDRRAKNADEANEVQKQRGLFRLKSN